MRTPLITISILNLSISPSIQRNANMCARLCIKCGGYTHKPNCPVRLQELIQTKKEIAWIKKGK